MGKNFCKDCESYYQHYAMNGRKIFRVNCGHCVKFIKKAKKPYAMACDAFVQAEQDENAFVNKEYLSKELLRYVLNLELLPEIADEPGENT